MIPSHLELRPVSRRPIRLPDETVRAVLDAPIPVVDSPAYEPRVSIIVVTFNQLVLTRMCLETLLDAFECKIEIIVVDNASADGTPDYLRDLAAKNPCVRPIFNTTNFGFAAANNQGLAVARGEVMVLLNNDTIPASQWLHALIRRLDDPAIGLVGPVTNRIGNEQQIDALYRNISQLEEFAVENAVVHKGEDVDLQSLAMFCVAMRRDTFMRVGPLDEQFGLGLFEDDDYAMRVRAAGLRVVCARDAFVHHFGEGSFGELFADGRYSRLFEANKKRFEAKWQVEWKARPPAKSESYLAMAERVRSLVAESLPADAKVLVISHGDAGLLELHGRHASHFPQDGNGDFAHQHPADSAAAIDHLESLDADYLLVPATSLWWLDHYADFRKHLEANGRLVVRKEDAGAIYEVKSS